MASSEVIQIKRALISVTDKKDLEKIGRALQELGVEILSSGGTATYLKEQGVNVVEVSEFTGAPEMLDGRLKTLHPKIHGGLLAIRDNSTHMTQMKEQSYVPIDLVIVNLYAFESAARTPDKSFLDVVEKVDIGGPTLLRSAAKNYPFVAVLVEPEQYENLLRELDEHHGGTTLEFRKAMARRVFERTAAYDATIAQYFQKESDELPKHFPLALESKWPMRYGENPHQKAGFYLPARSQGETVIERVLQGKQLSYNNLLDIHGALDLMTEFHSGYVVAILKHTNPCGVGTSTKSLEEAYIRALECDPVSAFGGIVVFSHEVNGETAKAVGDTFTEIVIAPKFDEKARGFFEKKKNLRMLEVDYSLAARALGGVDVKRVVDGFLVQERDRAQEDLAQAKIVTTKKPTQEEWGALSLAWKVAKHVKSNAIVLANGVQTVGVGAGQMSRVDSSKIAAMKSEGKLKTPLVLASDAFFPFRDSIDEAAKYGVTAIVQPGGSIRDEEVIQAANENGMSMLFTTVRHFKH